MKQFKRLIIPYFIWAVVILLIPLFLIALYAVTKEGNEVLTVTFTWGNIPECDPEILLAWFTNYSYLPGAGISTGLYDFKIPGKSTEYADPPCNHSYVDQ